jgi:NADH:ubiquinone oxidoreductase subunit B-like Fe-S oxidoreductase
VVDAKETAERVQRWAALRGRSALVVVGALSSPAARTFAERVVDGDALPLPTDAADPAQADVLIVIGRIAHKLAPALVALCSALPKNARVLAFDDADDAHYAVARADAVVDVDVLVEGIPPDDETLGRALDALFAPKAA